MLPWQRMPPTDFTFTNPIITSRDAADPWVIRHGDSYLFTATFDDLIGIFVWRSPSLTKLDQTAEKVLVWPAPGSGPRCAQIWAPELHFLQGRWYLYYTASDGIDDHHRHYVLRSVTEDALCPYDDLGLIDPAFDHDSIDGSILALPDGRLFWMDTLWGTDVTLLPRWSMTILLLPLEGRCGASGPVKSNPAVGCCISADMDAPSRT